MGNRREFLAQLGGASAASLLWAFGCRASTKDVRFARDQIADVRSWLRDAVSRLAAAFPEVHALAVSRRRTTGALDVLGVGIAYERRDGVVLSVRTSDGRWREHVTTELTQSGVLAAVRALVDNAQQRTSIDFPEPGAPPVDPPPVTEAELRNRLGRIQRGDRVKSSRLVYSAALIDVEDVDVWSVAPEHDRQQRARRIRHHATRAAWNGARPVIEDIERGWVGELGDPTFDLSEDDVSNTSARVLQALTPGLPTDGVSAVVFEPALTAALVEIAATRVLSSDARRRPEIAKRIAAGRAGSDLLHLVDDPTVPAMYGGFSFSDRGAVAEAVPLVEGGRIVGPLARRRRPGHIGPLAIAPSHLVLAPGPHTLGQLSADGWQLEGANAIAYDPSSDRIVMSIARARELRGGTTTGRVYADIELTGELSQLLGHVEGLGNTVALSSTREVVDGEPRWRSISAPHLRSRAMVRARRGAT